MQLQLKIGETEIAVDGRHLTISARDWFRSGNCGNIAAFESAIYDESIARIWTGGVVLKDGTTLYALWEVCDER